MLGPSTKESGDECKYCCIRPSGLSGDEHCGQREAVSNVKFVHAGRSGGQLLKSPLVYLVISHLLTLIGVMLGLIMIEVEDASKYSRIRLHGLSFK